jgi:putative ABC transport system permease protein
MPDWKSEIRRRLIGLNLELGQLDDIVEELAQHLDDRYAELLESGMPSEHAREVALRELASDRVLARALRPVERPSNPKPVLGKPVRGHWVRGIRGDVRDGLRAFRNNPGLSAVALLTLSVSIGANAAIFSVVNAAILRPLPFVEPDRLVSFWGSAPQMGLPVVNYPDALYAYFRTRSRTLHPIAAYASASFTLTGTGDPERVTGAWVTADFFSLLGRTPRAGRDFTPEEETPHGNRVVVLSDGFWHRRFGADPQMVGKSIMLDGRLTTVIGIMPPGVDFPNRSELWVPLGTNPQSLNCWCFPTIGRLAAGQTPESAAREIASLNDSFWPEREGKTPEQPTTEHSKSIVIAKPLARELVGDARSPLLVLLGAVGMVLLIACANIANLLLVRANARGKEIAVRCCLGASPWRIARQLLIESLLLALAGATLGLMLASWGATALGRLTEARLSYVHDIRLDPVVLAFTVGLTLATVVLFGVAPAFRGARIDLRGAITDGGRTTRSISSRRLADTFVVAQLALCIVLSIGAGLLLKSLSNLLAVDPGFRPENVLVGRLTLPFVQRPADEAEAHARAFFAQLAERVQALPGVRNVGLSSSAPFSNGNNQQTFGVKGREPARGQPTLVASVRSVTPEYFAAVGTPVRRGRTFQMMDSATTPLVAVVDETLAHRYWPDGNVIGNDIRLGDGPWRTIVGVVASIKHGDLSEDSDRYIYVPHAQAPADQMDLVVRADTDPSMMVGAIRQEIQRLDPALPFYEVHTLEGAVARSLSTRRVTNSLLFAFAIAALILAAVGLYGVIALSVSQRIKEFGIRLALGATRADVLTLVLRQGMRLLVVGLILGLAGAVGVTGYLGSLLFHVRPLDPLIFTGVVLLLVTVALGACYIPARRATATDPLEALRYQ